MINHPGLLISFDGTDSSGKATQARLLAGCLQTRGHRVYQFATPDYQTKSGQVLKACLQNKTGIWSQTPWPEKLRLFSTNRAEHQAEVIDALARGGLVIYDRYVPSSLGFITIEALRENSLLKRADIHSAIRKVEYQENNMPPEDVSIFLDVPPQISTTLLERRKEKLSDEHEYTDHIQVQERLYNEYNLLCHDNPTHYLRIKCVAGDRLLNVADIAELVWTSLLAKFPQLAQNT